MALAGVATLTVSLLTALVLAVSWPSAAQADVRVEVAGGRVTITLTEVEQSPERIEAATRSAGLDVRVTAVPVGPSRVGRFVSSNSTGELPPEFQAIGGASTFAGFSLPEGWTGSLQISVGRPALEGETYVGYSNAFADGEPLACTGLQGGSAGAAASVLRQRPIGAEFQFRGPNIAGRAAPDEVQGLGLDDWVVAEAQATAADRVVLRLVPPGSVAVDAPPTQC